MKPELPWLYKERTEQYRDIQGLRELKTKMLSRPAPVYGSVALLKLQYPTLPETNMETHKGPYEDY